MIAALLLTFAAQVEPRTTLEVADDTAWREPGLRVGFGYAADLVAGVGGALGGLHHSAVLRIGQRLDDDWSIFLGLRYGLHLGDEPTLRFGGAIEPTLHLTDSLSISAGLGIGGFVIGDTGAPTPDANIIASLTLPDNDPLIGECTGAGVLATARIEQLFIANDLFATGPSLQVDAQWTACTERLDRASAVTGEALELRQYWQNYGVSLAWLVWWR